MARFYIEQGIHIHNKSTLPTKIVYDFEKLLIMNNLTEPFDSTEKAKQYLDNIGMSIVPEQMHMAYLKQLEVESILLEGPITPLQADQSSDLRSTIRKIAAQKEKG